MDDLTIAVEATDLPALVQERHPDSGAKPGVQETIYATWRGNANTPSFSLFRHNGVWLYSDKVTEQTGNAFDFLVQIEGMGSAEASEYLKERAGIMRTDGPSGSGRGRASNPQRPMRDRRERERRVKERSAPKEPEVVPLEGEARDAFLSKAQAGGHRPKAMKGRGLLASDLDEFMIVADGDDALIPILSPDGELLNVKRRRFEPKSGPKYRYEFKGHGSPPWCSPNLGDPDVTNVLIVEGEVNGMLAYSIARAEGWNLAVMAPAGSDGRIYHEVLEDRRVYAYGDNDQHLVEKGMENAGQVARARWLQEAKGAGARAGLPIAPFERDFCDSAGEDRTEFTIALKRAMREADANPSFDEGERRIATYTINEVRESAERYISGEILLPTGFEELDNYTGGLPEHDLTLVAALPGTGKSAWMRQVILTYLDAISRNKVLLFTPDQSASVVIRLIASARSGVPLLSMRTGNFPDPVKKRHGGPQEAVKAWREAFDDTLIHLTKRLIISEKQDFREVKQEIWRRVEEGIGLVAFDYIQLFEVEGDDSGRGAVQVMRELKHLSTNEAKVPILLAAQLAKYKFGPSRRTGIPIVTDVEGTGKYHQLPNQIYLLYNQSKYLSQFGIDMADYKAWDENDAGKARCIVAKNKEGEDGRFYYLRWNPQLTMFRSMTQREWPE